MRRTHTYPSYRIVDGGVASSPPPPVSYCAGGDLAPRSVGDGLLENGRAAHAVAVCEQQVDRQRRSVLLLLRSRAAPNADEADRVRIVRIAVLVQDAAWLFFATWIVADSLQPRQLEECGARHGWEIVQQVQGHAKRIAPRQWKRLSAPAEANKGPFAPSRNGAAQRGRARIAFGSGHQRRCPTLRSGSERSSGRESMLFDNPD